MKMNGGTDVMRDRSCAQGAREGRRGRPAIALITMLLVLGGLSTLKLR
jgi:hypothetical protein